MKDDVFTAISWNIRKCKGGFRGRVTPAEIAASLTSREPDLVLCQEVFHSTKGIGQSDAIAGGLDMAPVYGPNAIYARGHHGNATMTPHCIENSFNRDVSTNRIEKRGVLYGRIRLAGQPLHVFNTHLGLTGRQRRRQIDYLAELIEELCPAGEAVLLGGDFNDWHGRLDRGIADSCQLISSMDNLSRRSRRSWPSAKPIFGLDRIYFRGLECLSVEVLTSAPWNRLSDHLPVEARFKFTPANLH